jgi:hypothetical protein
MKALGPGSWRSCMCYQQSSLPDLWQHFNHQEAEMMNGTYWNSSIKYQSAQPYKILFFQEVMNMA